MRTDVNSRRGYDSPRRREQAGETRRRILDAAEELFTRDGYAATAMPAIAEQAAVALKTVYLAFGTKAGVLHGLWDVRLGGDDQDIPVVERPWYRQLLRGDDPASLIRVAARQSRVVKERAGELMRIIRQAADTEPALADLWDRIETEFRDVLGGLAGRLDELGALAPGVDVTLATDLLWTLSHPDTWYLLVHGCGWAADRYEQWVGDTLTAQLLGAAALLQVQAGAGFQAGYCGAAGGGGHVHQAGDQAEAVLVEYRVVDGVAAGRGDGAEVVDHLARLQPRGADGKEKRVHRVFGDGEGVAGVE